jgi:hypothetical protein
MKNFYRLILATTILLPNIAMAIDFMFSPRIMTGVTVHRLKYDPMSSITTKENLYYNMLMLGVGATFIFDRFFIDVAYKNYSNGHDNVVGQIKNEDIVEDNTIYTPRTNLDYKRYDHSISLGYSFHKNFSSFIGYKWSNRYTNAIDTNIFIGDDLGQPVIDSFYYSNSTFGGNWNSSVDGRLIGIAFSLPISNIGKFTASVSYARLTLEQKVTAIFKTPTQEAREYIQYNNANANSFGLNFNWTAPIINKRTYYIISLGGSRYEFGNTSKERLISLQIAIKYDFF